MGDRIRINRANTSSRRNEPEFIVEAPIPPPPPPTGGNRRNRPRREQIIEEDIIIEKVVEPQRRRNNVLRATSGRANLNDPLPPPPPPQPQVIRRRPEKPRRSHRDEKPAIIEIVNDSRPPRRDKTRSRPHSPPRPPIPTPKDSIFIANPTIRKTSSGSPKLRRTHSSRIHDLVDDDNSETGGESKGTPLKIPIFLGAGGPGIKDVTAGKKNGRVFLARTRTVRSSKKRPTVIRPKPDSPEGSI